MLDDAGDEDETGHEADDDGVPERAGHGNQRLALRVAGLGRGGDERSGTHTGFIGEKSAGEAVAAGHGDRAADEAAGGSLCRERGGDDRCDCFAEDVGVHDKDDQAADEVEDRHEGHKHLGNSGDRLDAADDDEADQNAEHDRDDPRSDAEVGREVGGNRVGLNHAADTERADRSEDREEDACPAGLEAAVEGVHRAADHRAVFTLHAVLDGDQGLGVLGGDAEDTGQPHPEDGARAAAGDRGADADDVAGADG